MQSLNAAPWVPGLPFGALSFRKDSAAFGQPTPALVGLTEFYINSAGANINAGSGTGAAIYTSVTGGWSTVTNIFTPADNSNPVAAGVQVGMYASIYNDGATTAVYITAITQVVNAVNGAITVSTTRIYGTAPVTGATVSMKVSGAWVGPSGAVTFPFGLSGTIGALKDANSNMVRLNVKNDQTYTMTAQLSFATLGIAVMQGYTTNPGDLGKAIFTSNVTASINFVALTAGDNVFADLIFVSTGGSGATDVFQTSAPLGTTFLRCVFHGGRGAGLVSNAGGSVTPTYVIECEAYDCNKSNTANKGAFQANGITFFYNSYAHDNTAGVNAHGFAGAAGCMILVNCISETNTGSGAQVSGAAAATLTSINSNYYNNTADGVTLATAAVKSWAILINNNFLTNGGRAINNTVTSQGGIIYNSGRGLGNQQNALGDTLRSIVNTGTDIFYPANTTPWNAPVTGDFTTVAGSLAVGAGRGKFEETDGTNTGTLSYPVIGASTAIVPASKGGLRLAGHGGLAA